MGQAEYLDALHMLADRMPGLGGREVFDGLTMTEVLGLADRITRKAEREAAAAEAAVAKARARGRRR